MRPMRAISLTLFGVSSTFPTLSVGDLFFRTNANTYAFIHNGLATNGLYQITATQSAQTVLGNPSGNYRPAAQVWASPNGAHLLSTGSSSIATVNGAGPPLPAAHRQHDGRSQQRLRRLLRLRLLR